MKTSSNRYRVIVVASDLFLNKGLDHTSMDDVVLASGVAKSNIYYHFKSKEELVVAVLDYRIQELRDAVEAIIAARVPVAKRIELLYRAFAKKLEERQCAGGCPILSLMSAPIDEVKVRSRRFFEELQSILEKLLTEGVQSGELKRDIPVAQTAALMLSALEGAIALAQTHGDAESIIRTGETILRFVQVQ